MRLSFTCDDNGRIGNLVIAESSGSEVLDAAARDFLSHQACARAAGHFEKRYHFILPDQ